LIQRYEDICGLTPKAVGVGGGIDRSPSYLWKSLSISMSVDDGAIKESAEKMGVSEEEYLSRLEASFG